MDGRTDARIELEQGIRYALVRFGLGLPARPLVAATMSREQLARRNAGVLRSRALSAVAARRSSRL